MKFILDVQRSNVNFESLLIVLFSLLPIVDSINGMLTGVGGISSIYKMIILGVLFISIVSSRVELDKFKFKTIFFIIMYVMTVVLFNVKSFNDSIISISFPVKLIYNILLFYLLFEALKGKILLRNSLITILNNNSWVFIVCFLIPYFLGLGNTIYASGMGYKAFFISQNELSFVLLVLCLFTSYELYLKITILKVVQLFLLVMCGFLINTKSTVFGCMLGVIILIFMKIKKSNSKIKIITMSLILLFFLLCSSLIVSSVGKIISRFSSLRVNYYDGSVLTAILSGRNLYIEEAWRNLIENHFLFRFIFGNGFCTRCLIEMDFIDMFFFMGLIGESVFLYFIYRLSKIIYDMRKFDLSRIRFYYFFIILIFIFITGHVIFMSMSGIYFIMFSCFLITYKSYQGDKKNV